jgi:AraC-like DNA-binding protein
MSSVPTVVACSAAKIARFAARSGSPDRLLRTVGLDRDAVRDPGLRIPYADMMLLSEHAARMTRDTALGLHVGEQVDHREYGLVGKTVLTSPTLGDALRSLERYLPIWTDVGIFRLMSEGRSVQFQWHYSSGSLPECRHDCETSMAAVMGLNRFAAGAPWRPREVWFQHAQPDDTTEYARIFRAPVRFRMPVNALLLDAAILQHPMKTAQPHARRLAMEEAESLLGNGPEDVPVSQKVLTFIRQNLEIGDFGLEAAARHLSLSRRSLQRKLRAESSSYRDLVQQARQDLSQYLLLESPTTATATAYALGYSEPSVFQRAFLRWYGKPPGEYRKS